MMSEHKCPQWIEENPQRRTRDDGREIWMKALMESCERNCQSGSVLSKKKSFKSREREHHLSLHKHVDRCRLAVPSFCSKDNNVWFSMSEVVDL
ncbi:hypothetical protein VNO80_24696 [Phaseolus coccineus]|uniref:Uncharacterized protein n=1 Tax=Phaseolus coccineus TaxID=3886 RepID=A0AAN9LT95_PHACN